MHLIYINIWEISIQIISEYYSDKLENNLLERNKIIKSEILKLNRFYFRLKCPKIQIHK